MTEAPNDIPQMGEDSPYNNPDVQADYKTAINVDHIETERAVAVGALSVVGEANAIRTDGQPGSLESSTRQLAYEMKDKVDTQKAPNHPSIAIADAAINLAERAGVGGMLDTTVTPAENAWEHAKQTVTAQVASIDERLDQKYQVLDNEQARRDEAQEAVAALRKTPKEEAGK